MFSLRPTRSLLHSRRWRPLALGLFFLSAGMPAAAQLGLPGLPQLPGGLGGQLPVRVETERLRERLLDTAELPRRIAPDQIRLRAVRELLQRYPAQLEADPSGFPIVRREILAWSPSEGGLTAAAALGLAVSGGQEMAEVGLRLVVLRVPDGLSTTSALAALRAADPDGTYDFNHVYTSSTSRLAGDANGDRAQGASLATPDGTVTGGDAAGGGLDGAAAGGDAAGGMADGGAADGGDVAGAADGGDATGGGADGAAAGGDAAGGAEVRVGLVDSGLDGRHEVFARARVVRWGCGGAERPAPHGTAVAALLVGQSARFTGALPSAKLYAADIYCDQPTGGSAAQIVQALSWLAKEQVGVINLSLVGPPNELLGRAVQAMVKRGHLLVAAVGNDGPAAPPLYPASYPGVVGVTGIDPKRRPLPEAARGPQVMFAAPGNQMVAAAIGKPPYKLVRGTSFASPLVAALLAPRLPSPAPAQAAQAVEALASTAIKAGDGTGRGIVGEKFRIPPSAMD